MKWAVVLAALASPLGAAGQIAESVATVETGTVRFSYAARTGVEICARGIRFGDRHVVWRSNQPDDEPTRCRVGIVEVELEVRGGMIRGVELVRAMEDRVSSAVDIGEVPPEGASRYLLALASDGASDAAAEGAILPAVLADVDSVGVGLLEVVRNRRAHDGARKNALFWLGQEAASAVTDGLAVVALDEDENQEIRDAAIFALSQRPAREGVPILMELATDAREAETRRTAMFWLAQSGDDRVVDFFERILLGKVR